MKNLLLIMAVFVFGVAKAQAQVSMNIHYNDGSTVVVEASNLDSVSFPLDPMNQNVDILDGSDLSDPLVEIDSVTFSGVGAVPLSCFDGLMNNGEDAPDCGGPCPPCGTCADGIQTENWVPWLEEFVMEDGVDCGFPCLVPCAPSCTDGIQNGDEEGIDCGGSCDNPCPPPTCNDGVWNGTETGVDCGGPDCPPCPTPSCEDGIQNQNEEGIDCGGVCPEECPEATCFDGIQNQFEEGIDCGGPCPTLCPPANCNDGVQNQDEEWIDCGGTVCPNLCPTCDDGIQNGPEVDIDCVVGNYPNYYGGMCPQCPTCYDGLINNSETYIDCGGPNCQPCEMYLNAENLGSGLSSAPFEGENFEVTQQGLDLTFTATQTIGGEVRTLSIKIPLGMAETDTEPVEDGFLTGPAVQYINFSGTVLEGNGENGDMTIDFKTAGNDPDHIMGTIGMLVTMEEQIPGEATAEATNITFFINY